MNTRRDFFGWTRNLVAAGGLAGSAFASPAEKAGHAGAEGEDYYGKLGVPRIINAAGTYTVLTASTMPPSVRAAVDRAARHPVRLLDLQTKAGEYLARRLQCQGAMVTAGAASALTLGTAACITIANGKDAVDAMPGISSLKNEVVVQKAHRYGYDHAMRNCGIRIVEVETPSEYESAFTDRTVMTNFFNAAEGGQIGREDWIRIAHAHGVPCFNDAAADVPPVSNLWNYTKMGFDLVAFSGGKGMRGPQNAGLLLGRKDLIEAAARSNNPYDDTVGRGMKVAKEQIVGMVAAVDWFLEQGDEKMQAEFQRRADRIARIVKDIPSVSSDVFVPPVANHVPHLLIRYDRQRVKIAPKEVAEELRQGTPSIELNPATGSSHASSGLPTDGGTIVVGVWMLEPGEDLIVARRLHEVLKKASNA